MLYELKGFKPRSKARPNAGRGRMFVPKAYTEWKCSVRAYLSEHYSPVPTEKQVSVEIVILSPTRPRGDLDNIAGGLLDAIQPARARGNVVAQRHYEACTTLNERLSASPGCLIVDDAQVDNLTIRYVSDKRRSITIIVEEIS